MSCDDVRERLITSLAMPDPTIDADVRAHLDSCAACRAARDDYHTLWRQLGDLDTPHPPPDARARFDRRLADVRRAASIGSGRPTPWYVGAWAATALIAALVGYTFGVRRTTERARSAQTAPAGSGVTFLMLLHVDSTFHHGQTPAAAAAIVAEYGQWVQGLLGGATLVSGASLADSTAWFGPSPASLSHGDHIAGFFMIRAPDRATALRVAATCPHLKYGGRIELRFLKQSTNEEKSNSD